MRQVHADLVRASGLQTTFEQTGEGPVWITELLDETIPRASILPASAQDCHAFAVERVATDRTFDDAFSRPRRAPDDGMISALDSVIGELLGEATHGALVFCRYEKSARILVEAVNDAWSRHSADTGERRTAMGDECVDEGSVRISRSRMHDETGRLFDDDEVFVFVYHVKRDVLALRDGRCGRRNADGEDLARFDPEIAVSYRFARMRDGTALDQLLKARTADVAEGGCEKAVEPPTRLAAADDGTTLR